MGEFHLRALIGILVLAQLPACTHNDISKTQLERIRERGELRVLTRNSPTTYYIGPEGEMGLEYDLARRFADYLGVELKVIVPDTFGRILPMIGGGEADLAAAGLTVTEQRRERVRFGPIYQEIVPQVVYRRNGQRPRNVGDLAEGHLEVVAGSSHAELLEQLAGEHPQLTWSVNRELEAEDLLYLVSEQLVDYTVADSNEIALNRRFYPELRVAFGLSDPQPLAWALPPGEDNSLYAELERFFRKVRNNGELERLVERYYGHVEDFDYVGTRHFLRQIKQRLPEYRSVFEKAGEHNDLDWRLLAAMGYQESHWNPRARSPTGVRGIMMLTLPTARQLDVDNRLDPSQSILGGAEYFRKVKRKVPERIPEPDRTWMALAAYNVGFGHLEDARKLTQTRGGDPDKWVDVKQTLPLLSQKKWYRRTRYGYARGREPVRYVENIRSYYDLLVRATESENRQVPMPEVEIGSLTSPVF
ncbi:MAG: membrane-bound lytic murein transglycosylase MltF [Gammaproteobacteria bacterium]|nr:membrane-bound lytic murein transglycosylase MltF [Gammaproteobacteria bacterium]NIR97885.1 membrane-bound lytic murein transglycosylase MltF [Gammaproteobacteria bacterium]NIT63590.1 membrane-bound lytic murein transglycosylase MltF [Gammaproteobacteria bacterium]NIV20526.1 membrane-bound lytic murein transglycosylase MltF [Gammaproteobacteria bacterium]NIX11120.1 membrane-bound lytic murein transglycosylase MltF [Gammaproteobacteria bacterium]